MTVLFLDIGTSHTNLAWLDPGSRVLGEQRSVPSGLDGWRALADLLRRRSMERIVACTVTKYSTKQAQAELMRLFPTVPVTWFASQARFGDLINAYPQPGRLGADRWHAMIAARALSETGYVVVDAGSAITVDYVTAEGRHLGGMIAPGIGMLRSALAVDAALGVVSSPGIETPMATNTATACAQGIEVMIEGVRANIRKQLRQHLANDADVFTCGGDAVHFASLAERVEYRPGLVLEGMSLRDMAGV